MAHDSTAIDHRSGFCSSNSTFYSKRKPLSLPSQPFLDAATFISSRHHSGTVALIEASTGRQLTYPELWRAVDAVATSLSNLGIRKGHVIFLLSPNSIHFPIVCLSVMSLGAIITTANPLNTPEEIAKQIADSKPILAFTTHALAHKIGRKSNLPVVLLQENDGGSLTSSSSCRVVAYIEDMMTQKPDRERIRDPVRQEDTAIMLYSSGTTGMSKGVVSSHRNLIATIQTIIQRFSADGDELHTLLCTVPMFHIYGMVAFATGMLAMGYTIVVLSKFEMHDMLSAIGKYRVSYLPLVPPILVALMNHADVIRAKYDLRSLRKVLSGGAPLSKEVIDGFLEKFPRVEIMQGYGLTETTGIGASTDTLEESKRYGTAGLLSPSMEAKIVDTESGEALGVRKSGELWLRGPTVMKGYFSNPEATGSTLDAKGWLRTGDVCYIDEDGYIFVVDRLKELIKYKGYQVAPAELEALLLSHPEIVDAAVIPYPDKEVGQYPMAYVVRKAGSNLSEDTIMKYIAKQVAPYKRIRRVAFVSSIPKNPSGKILRKDLIKLATSKL